MTTRPRPRPRAPQKSKCDPQHAVSSTNIDNSFFLKSRSLTKELDRAEQESSDKEFSTCTSGEEDHRRPRRKRKAVSFDWVTKEPAALKQTEKVLRTPSPSIGRVQEEIVPTFDNQIARNERNVSVSPPPPELELEGMCVILIHLIMQPNRTLCKRSSK